MRESTRGKGRKTNKRAAFGRTITLFGNDKKYNFREVTPKERKNKKKKM